MDDVRDDTTGTPGGLGIFDQNGDIGLVGAPGEATFADDAYRVTGSGQNMWFGEDAFHFVWRQWSGDFSLSAAVDFEGNGIDPHRKAVLLVRAGPEADAAYADIALHGDGLISLQFRRQKGAATAEVQTAVQNARHLELRCSGTTVSAFVDGEGTGASIRLDLPEHFLVGLGVCSHVDDVLETAVFSEVALHPVNEGASRLFSTIETIDIASADRRVVMVREGLFEAPNWTADDCLIVNGEGLLHSVALTGGALTVIDTGFATACNNDHGVSPDGTRLVISDQSENGRSIIYTLPRDGGTPQQMTNESPSYWHGWSPEGSTLTYCGERDGVFGIFTVPADGSGDERRVTTAVGLDDGPDYSPDGEWIYFNSDRSGVMQIHRVRPGGGNIERVIESDTADWFPHVSPDGRWVVHLAYAADVIGHPRDQMVNLVLTDRATGLGHVIAELFGGQGTINVPSWSPDSTRFAFVSYAYL